MKLAQHPEYHIYTRAWETAQRCREAVAAWKASGEPIVAGAYSLHWTFEQAQAFVCALSHLFQEYNQVLWEQFPYCRRCGGGCCVLDATHVGLFDAIALALLDQSLPTLTDEIEATARDCVYLVVDRCAWSAVWRPVKCWVFYCALGERTDVIAKELGRVILDLLPDALREYEAIVGISLVAHLDDPVEFANAFSGALLDIFAAPFNDRYPVIDCVEAEPVDVRGDIGLDGIADVLAFITEAVEQVCQSPTPNSKELDVSTDQLLADLELLEWIVLGHPENGAKLLEEMALRYASVQDSKEGERATVWYRMRNHVLRLRDNWN